MRKLVLAMAAAVVGLHPGAASAQKEVQFWHAMGGQLGDVVNALADEFNKSQSDYKVVPVFKGSYAETMNAGVAAYRASPHIIQIFEVGTATMMGAKGAVKPVYQLMAELVSPSTRTPICPR